MNTLYVHNFNSVSDLKIFRSNFKTEDEDAIKVFDKKSEAAEKLIIKLADLHDSLNDVVNDINQCHCLIVSLS